MSRKSEILMSKSYCRKEAKESRYWLRLLELRDAEQEEKRQALVQEATELMKIFGSILQKSN